MRLKSEIWVKAYVRRCSAQGVPALILRRGQSDAGAIFIKVNRLDGSALVLGPAPAGFDDMGSDRRWVLCHGDDPWSETDADAYLDRQHSFDSDIWVIEVEDREGRHFLDDAICQL